MRKILVNFPSGYKNESKEPLVGAYRAESTLDYTAERVITTKNPPLFVGSTSLFKFEESSKQIN